MGCGTSQGPGPPPHLTPRANGQPEVPIKNGKADNDPHMNVQKEHPDDITKPTAEISPRVKAAKEDLKAEVTSSEHDVIHAQNDFSTEVDLPDLIEIKRPADIACIRSKNNAKWPIRCFCSLDFNVNAGYGGCASLLLLSCSYNKGDNSTTEIFLLRSGFDCNHVEATSLVKSHGGHFGAENGIKTDEDGRLLADCLFGMNFACLLSNDSRWGHGGVGVVMDGPEEEGETAKLRLNVNGGSGGGTSILMCSGVVPGVDTAKVVSCMYVISSGAGENAFRTKKLFDHGEDLWKFSVDAEGVLQAAGPMSSRYALFHNRDTFAPTPGGQDRGAKVRHTQAYRGDSQTVLLPECRECGTAVVLCSSSSGPESATTASLYVLTIATQGDQSVEASFAAGSSGKGAPESADQWKFAIANGKLVVEGPPLPCRYAILSNFAEDKPDDPKGRCHQDGCLATNESSPVRGVVSVDGSGIRGWVTAPSDVVMKVNERTVAMVKDTDLVSVAAGRMAFTRRWAEDETTPGLRLVRVFASKTDQDNKKLLIELEGSPFQHVIQPKGVLFALNTAGPSYQALNNIVYLSEHRLYHNYETGPKSKTLGLVKTTNAMPQLLCGTYDGFIYGTARNHSAQTEDENRVTYNVPNLPNGNHTLTLHYVGGGGHIIINGQKRVNFKPVKTEVSPGYTAHTFSTPVTVSGGSLEFTAYPSFLCGFSICDASYVEPKQSSDDVKREQQERVKLGLEATPLPDSLEKKKMQIAGWSANLLENASGELGNISHWNIGGDWKISEGGYGTEKCFVTSHMRCTKYQEMDLTKTFSEEHLDSSPEIQVSEWYTQGVCGGGFYTLEVTLMTYDGDVIKRYKSGERGNLYSGQWHEEKVTFTDYGAGVRLVGIQSSGKDDKHWGGHYGARMSNAFVRVRKEANAAEDDKFADVISENVTEEERNQQAALREKVVQKVLTENAELWSQDSNEAQPMEDPLLSMQQGGKQKDSAEHDQEVNTTISKQRRSEKPKQREIRVFVSSTFKDFKGEREYLIKKTFRELNRLCAERSVFFTYVDLRWGITKEQSDDGRTISICLKEVDRCRPYFICMMGERFGWSQKEGEPDKLLNASFDYAIKHNEDLKWIEDHRFDTSVTQLEVQHAALNNPDGGRHRCFFYLRDPVNTDTGTVSPDDVQVFLSESDWHYEHQYKLRKAVLDAGMNVRNYKETEDACTLIMEDLQRCVDEDFPPGTEMTPMQREQEHHMAFADARRRVYIGRQEYFDKIDDFMAKNKSTPLVLVGESGSGKSALVANWVSKHEQAHPDHFVFVHFIGSSAESSNHVTLVRRLMEELKAFFNLTMAVPTSDTNLVRSLPVWLRMAGMMGRVLIVMDALNQLDSGTALVGEGDEHDLLWIPNEMPPGVSVLLSTLPGRAMEAASANGWEAFRVQPLQPEEKSAIIKGYLEDIYTKTLSEEQKQLIMDAPQTNNPLYLKALLDEMRLYGEFETVTTRIQHYLEAENPGVLFGKILERLENDFETGVNTRKDLVRLSTSAIWCSHRGLSEEELVTLLDVPSVVWSPFYLSLDDNLINRNGILNFFHDHLRQAVEARYLPTADDKRLKYLELADYFATREIDDRVVDELPFLLSKAGEMERLRTTITNLQIFQRMMKSVEGTFNLMKCWQQVGGYEQAEVDYLKALAGEPQGSFEQDKEDRVALLRSMAAFFVKAGLLKSARSLYEELLKMLESRYLDTHGAVVYHPRNFSFQHKCKHTDVLDVLHSLGNVCERQMELKRAEEFYTDALDRQTRLDTPKEKLYLVKGLLGLASVKSLKEDQKEAKKLLLRAKEVATSVLGPHHHYVASIVGQIGQVCYKQGRVDEALGFYLQELSKVRAIHGASHPRTAGVLNSIALVYDDKNDERAGEIYETALATMVQAYGNNHVDVAIIRYNLGAFYFATTHYARSKYQFEQATSVFESFLGPDHPDTAEAKEAMDTAAAFVKE